MSIIAVVLLVLALLVGGVGIAATAGKLPRNRFVGVRTPAALRDDESFRLANRIAAPTLLAAGVLLTIAASGLAGIGGILGIAIAVGAVVTAIVVAGMGASLGTKAATAAAPVGGCGQACAGCSLKATCEPG